MVTLEFARAEAMPVRFAKSPLWETVACARRIARGAAPPSGRLRAADVPILSELLGREQGYLPDFVAPPPLEPAPGFSDELARMRRTPPAVVSRELRRMHPRDDRCVGAAMLARSGGRADVVLGSLAAEIEQVWTTVVRPWWARIDAILEADILTRGRRLAGGGLTGLFSDLRVVLVDARRCTVRSSRQRRRVTIERELLLVPTVLGSPEVFTVLDSPWPSSVYYPARGAGAIWELPRETPGWLATLAGRPRTRVLMSLIEPATTTVLARRLGLAPASVSQHLQRLHRAGLLYRARIGAQVSYRLTPLGRRLLSLRD
jgi:DNA-binding transcriptional ArsR family regulator